MKPLAPAAVLSALLLAAPASALPLLPGASVSPPGVGPLDPIHDDITAVVHDGTQSFALDPTPEIIINNVSGVFRDAATVLGAGGFGFLLRIEDTQNIEGGLYAIQSIALTGYAGFSTDIAFRTDSPGDKGPASASRSADGDMITLRFDEELLVDGISPGVREESHFTSIVTDAAHFDLSGTARILGFLIDRDVYDEGGGVVALEPGVFQTVTLTGIAAPSLAPVPGPAAGLLLFGGLAGFAALRRRPRRV